ncbi:hypothetical protein Daus18300_003183 [Diaporthe australafricana]|uniref:NodB homology domain-containing protein n=1 Tax=Diaporthe australafricana TaxID=127596 RepID=A0ABR3XIF6_9PEZI
MNPLFATSLAVVPSLARAQALPFIQDHSLKSNDTTLVPLISEGGSCGYGSPKHDAVCGHGLCCSLKTRTCGSDAISCGPTDCLPKYSTGCEWQGEINAELQLKDPSLAPSPEHASSSSFQKRQDAAAQVVDASSSSTEDLYKRPSLHWLVDLPRPALGSVPYGELITTCAEPGTIALTFDDGPWKYTEDLLDILQDHGVEATFFVCGGNMGGDGQITDYGHPQLLQRMANEGHQVATHTWAHADLTKVDEYGILDQLLLNEQAIVQALGRIPTYFRPPYFSSNEDVLDTVGQLGYHVINAGVDTNDWKGDYDAAKQAFSQAIQQGQWDGTGKIVLAHDIHERTVHELAEYMIEQALSAGYRLVTVGECMGDPEQNWYRDPRDGGPWTAPGPAGSELSKRDMIPSPAIQSIQSKESLERLRKYHPETSAGQLHNAHLNSGHVSPLMATPTATERLDILVTRDAEPSESLAADVTRHGLDRRFGTPNKAQSTLKTRANFALVLALANLFFLLQ